MMKRAPAIDEINDATRERSRSAPPIKKLNIIFIPSEVPPDDISPTIIYENKKQAQPILVKTKDGAFVVVCILWIGIDF
jgi:hypothetical protein